MKQILYERLIQYILENQDRFYRIAYSYTKHQDDALDAVQNAVCKALEAHENIKNADAIKTWFYRILINESLTALKKRNKVVLTADTVGQETAYYEKGYEQEGDIYNSYINSTSVLQLYMEKNTKKARIEATVLNSLTSLSKAEICKILPDVSNEDEQVIFMFFFMS